MEIPREARRALFPGFLGRGVVIRVEQYPFLYTGTRDKFLVLLNQQFAKDRTIYCVLTTSQTQGMPFPELSMILPTGTVPCFPVETAITCREVHPLDFDFLAERYAVGTLDFLGALPPAVLAQVDYVLRQSPYLAPAIAREIL